MTLEVVVQLQPQDNPSRTSVSLGMVAPRALDQRGGGAPPPACRKDGVSRQALAGGTLLGCLQLGV